MRQPLQGANLPVGSQPCANYAPLSTKKTWTVEGYGLGAWLHRQEARTACGDPSRTATGALINYAARSGDCFFLLLASASNLSGLVNPMLKFYLFHSPHGTASDHTGGFRSADGTDIMLGEPIVYNDNSKTEGWHEYLVAVPAEACSGTTRIIFAGVPSNGSYGSMFIDNISIKSYLADNLAVTGISVPKSVAIGESSLTSQPHRAQNKGVNLGQKLLLLSSKSTEREQAWLPTLQK